jgi:hypothetical protein
MENTDFFFVKYFIIYISYIKKKVLILYYPKQKKIKYQTKITGTLLTFHLPYL